jgi:hypothetical protein
MYSFLEYYIYLLYCLCPFYFLVYITQPPLTSYTDHLIINHCHHPQDHLHNHSLHHCPFLDLCFAFQFHWLKNQLKQMGERHKYIKQKVVPCQLQI